MVSSDLLTAINVAIAISAILGNGMVIVVMTVRRRQFSSFTNRLICHQSVIDLVAGVLFALLKIVRPPSLTLDVDANLLGQLYCRFIQSDCLLWGINVTSTYNLVLITLERFLATCYPIKHRNYCSLLRVKKSMCSAWLIGFTYGFHNTLLNYFNQGVCEKSHLGTAAQVGVFILALSTEYLIPVFLMSFCYIRILITLRRRLAGPRQHLRGVMSRAKRNVIESMFLAVVMFVVCWTPAEGLYLTYLATNRASAPLVNIAFSGLLTCNMCVNPIIYCFKYQQFRGQFRELLTRRPHQVDVITVNDSSTNRQP
ncbi:adenosine receptor A2a-like [Asterias amurensis]|uniref:adenosine receptor A2a-like n=1 Tax=Asterias amurensis TaxID=7602 RepID=UPI003AB37620